MKTKSKSNSLCQPISQVVEIPFALAEIVAETQATLPHVARLAESALDVVYGLPALAMLELSADKRQSLKRILTNGHGSPSPPATSSFLVYDLETLATIEEAGGWTAYGKLGISVLCAYDSATAHYRVFSDELPDAWRAVYDVEPLAAFGELARSSSLLVGFNQSRFDRRVCEAIGIELPTPDYDVLVEGWIGQGVDPSGEYKKETHSGGLNDYALANLGLEKSGTGELAPQLWKQGRYREVIEYCLLDVRLTLALFRLTQERGWLDNPKTGKRAAFRRVGGER